ncbi:MAG: hypothetical protein WDN44_02080 [Sphingomonas sp.]
MGPTFSRPTRISIAGDIRIVDADGEPSWLQGGLGKTRFDGGADRGFRLRPSARRGSI